MHWVHQLTAGLAAAVRIASREPDCLRASGLMYRGEVRRLGRLLVAVEAVALALSNPAAADDCVVRGAAASLDQVVVRPSEGPPFTVALAGISAVARLDDEGLPATVAISGVVAFTGTTRDVWYTVATPVTAASGMVRLLRGARLVGVRARGSHMLGSAVVRAGDVHVGHNREPDEKIEGISVPCDALTLDDLDHADEATPGSMGGDGTTWGLRGRRRRMVLRSAPSPAATAVVVVAPGGEVDLVGERLAEREGWMQITTAAESVRLTGWIPRQQLEHLDSVVGGGSTCGCSPAPLFATIYADRKPHYQGPARIAPGTVLSGPGGVGSWARVEKAAEFQIVIFDGSDSVEVTAIPGVAGLRSYGYVQRAAVTPTRRSAGGQ
jgi:hypothetical protein